MDSTQVGVFKKAGQVGLTGLLQASSCALEAQTRLEVLSDFSLQTLEGKFAEQKFGGRLTSSRFPGAMVQACSDEGASPLQ